MSPGAGDRAAHAVYLHWCGEAEPAGPLAQRHHPQHGGTDGESGHLSSLAQSQRRGSLRSGFTCRRHHGRYSAASRHTRFKKKKKIHLKIIATFSQLLYISDCVFVWCRERVGGGAEEELHDAAAVWLDAERHPGGAESRWLGPQSGCQRAGGRLLHLRSMPGSQTAHVVSQGQLLTYITSY